jgi:iron complex transport system substrate-binding protein
VRVRLEEPASRVIALYGAFNEMLAAMGRERVIIARTSADVLPGSILSRPVIGTHMRPNVEIVAGLGPDLVLQMAGRAGAGAVLTPLERLGLPCALFQVADLDDLYSVMRRVGRLVGASAEADRVAAGMRRRIEAAGYTGTRRPRVFFEVRHPGLLTAGADSHVGDLIRAAGGVNCVTAPGRLARLSLEELLRLDPDVYLVQRGPMNPNPVPPGDRPRFAALSAVRAGRVLMVDEQVFSRPGPRNVQAVERLAGYLEQEFGRTAKDKGS